LLPAIVERFSKQYPRVKLHVELVQAALPQFQQLRKRKFAASIVTLKKSNTQPVGAAIHRLCA
jgi:hypothetical protein